MIRRYTLKMADYEGEGECLKDPKLDLLAQLAAAIISDV